MKYTVSKKADKKVEEDMKIICEEVLKKIKEVKSIILTGGFSRGEGPIKKEMGKFFPYNDYDIQIITGKKISKEELDKISIEISKKLCYRGIENFYPFRKEEQKMKENFYIDMKCDSISDLKKLLPRIRTYELKNNSKILYGEDFRKLIPNYNLNDISLSEAAKLLLDRMSQMIEYYSTENKHEKEFLSYIIQQAYAACCTSLLMLKGKYQIGYKKSMEILKENYKKDFPEIYEKIPNLSNKIEQFVKWKINPQKLPSEDVEKEWFIAKESIIEVSKFFFERFLNKKIENVNDLAKAVLKMRKEFYSPYIKEAIKRRVKIPSFADKIVLSILNKLTSIWFRHKYNQRLKDLKVYFKTNCSSPELVIFSSLIYLIDSIKKGNKIEEDILTKGKSLLDKVYPSKGENWEQISLDYANAYIAFFLQKI